MELLQRPFHYVSNRSRQRKLDVFFSVMNPTPSSWVLDLGGEATHPAQPHKQLLDIYPFRDRLVLVNLLLSNVQAAARALPGLKCVCGDGLRLPFADKTFDVCYCNAVIEHLFTWENQRRFAAEIMRVAKSWFVTTPNRWFPFEPHLRLPLVTWLPQSWQHMIGYYIGYNHLRRRYARGSDRREIRLLGSRELRQLFPGSRILRNGFVGFTPTFLVVGGERLQAATSQSDSKSSMSGQGRLRPRSRVLGRPTAVSHMARHSRAPSDKFV